MQLFYDLIPVLLFFVAFKFYNIYLATVVGIYATSLQALATRCWKGKWDRIQLFTFAIFFCFGGLTLYFHNPIFVKWKPTIIFWIFSLVIGGSHLFTEKPLMQRLLQKMLQDHGDVPERVWKKLNVVWMLFFALLGAVNLLVAYYLSDNAWVNFKFYGITGAMFMLSIFQGVYLMRYLPDTHKSQS